MSYMSTLDEILNNSFEIDFVDYYKFVYDKFFNLEFKKTTFKKSLKMIKYHISCQYDSYDEILEAIIDMMFVMKRTHTNCKKVRYAIFEKMKSKVIFEYYLIYKHCEDIGETDSWKMFYNIPILPILSNNYKNISDLISQTIF